MIGSANRKKSSLWKWIGICLLGIIAFVGVQWKVLFPLHVESFESGDGTQLKFRTNGDQLEVFTDQKWERFFAQGVNLGATLPGHDPGELPITKQNYLDWFAKMTEMGSNVVRIYTILPPEFYEAIVEYNQGHPEKPLYFIQGVWSPEEALIEKRDAYLPEIRDTFKQEITLAVQAVYGKADIPETPGKASGAYRANAGPYLMAWHIGTEWDPQMVDNTDTKHAGIPRFNGSHIRANEQATPFENWLAEMLDNVAVQERKFGWQHPLTFTNWVTTDPLTHPGEPTFEEDLASVDATHLEPVHWEAGYFASYHVYPYYPDFFRLDETLRTVTNEEGKPDSYQTYLRKLKKHHAGMPIMVTEFGVPSSIGIGHVDRLGRDQGGHNEQEQGEINSALFREIVSEGYAGAILFAWQDEWFKKTWNTMPFEIPADRRKLWLNVLTNEEMFGVIGMHPGKDGKIVMDGKDDDWNRLPEEEKQRVDAGQAGIKEMLATHDEAYLYVLVRLNEAFDPDKQSFHLGFDTIAGGNRHAPELSGTVLDEGLETLVTLGKDEESDIQIASNYDFHTRLYGYGYGMIPLSEREMKDDSGIFNPWKLAIGLEMTPPDTKFHHPFEDIVVGKLKRGVTDPQSPDYDSLALWQASGNVIELRIPWMLLGFTDPSSLQVMSYGALDRNGFQSETTKGIRMQPWMTNKATGKAAGLEHQGDKYPVSKLPAYVWEPWETVEYQERPKKSYEMMKKAYLDRHSASESGR